MRNIVTSNVIEAIAFGLAAGAASIALVVVFSWVYP